MGKSRQKHLQYNSPLTVTTQFYDKEENMNKKIISAILAASLLCAALSGCEQNNSSITEESSISISEIAETPASDFKYVYNEDLDGIVITEYTGYDYGVKIPSEIDGKKVISLNHDLRNDCITPPFLNNIKLVKVIIPESVIVIGDDIFTDCKNLKTVSLPKYIEEIKPYTFSGCKRLYSVTIPDSVCYVGEKAFEGCTSLTSLELPDSVKEIKDTAFLKCENLTVTYKGEYYSYQNFDELYKMINA